MAPLIDQLIKDRWNGRSGSGQYLDLPRLIGGMLGDIPRIASARSSAFHGAQHTEFAELLVEFGGSHWRRRLEQLLSQSWYVGLGVAIDDAPQPALHYRYQVVPADRRTLASVGHGTRRRGRHIIEVSRIRPESRMVMLPVIEHPTRVIARDILHRMPFGAIVRCGLRSAASRLIGHGRVVGPKTEATTRELERKGG